MKRKLLLLLCTIMFLASVVHGQWQSQDSGSIADFRGLSVVSRDVAWASGTRGTYVRTVDGGANWRVGNVPGAEKLDFRDVEAFDRNTAYLLSAGAGESSKIYKTTDGGDHWTLQYTNPRPKAFFDALAFWDANHGVALSDPVDGYFLIIITSDGGATWRQVSPLNMPAALPGEGAFAASGTCLVVEGKSNVWFATGGGATARVFRSADRGGTWKVATTPVNSRTKSSGIFSLAFRDAKHGVAVGGDYQKPSEAIDNIAITADGGRTWNSIAGFRPAGFRSAVAYVANRSGKTDGRLIAVGPSGSDYSVDDGKTWMNIDKVGYNSVAFAQGAGWAVGPKGRTAKYRQ